MIHAAFRARRGAGANTPGMAKRAKRAAAGGGRDEFKGMVALVTGAGSGIGAATAEVLAARGCAVGVLSHTPREVVRLASAINRRRGGRALALEADVADEDAMKRACKDLAGAFGGIDHVFANAGINGPRATLERLTMEEYDLVMRTNLRGTFVTVRAALSHLKRRKGGSIVITASINGTYTYNDPGSIIYSTTKAGQIAMSKFLAIELARHKIRVNVVCPGSIDTQIGDNTQERDEENVSPRTVYPDGEMPLTGKRPGKAVQVASVVAFLMGADAGHVTGAEVVVDGGQSLIV